MICPHCAFPNEPGTTVCVKCNKPAADKGPDSVAAKGSTGAQSEAPVASSDPVGPIAAARKRVAESLELEKSGDLRAAFVACQSILIDHFDDLSQTDLAGIYVTMGRISVAQDKHERARKYLTKAQSVDPENPQLAALLAQADEPRDMSEAVTEPPDEPLQAQADAVAEPALETEPAPDGISAQGRLAWAASFWSRALALGLDGLLVASLLGGMIALAALILGFDGAAVTETLAGGLTNLAVVGLLFFVMLLIYVTVFGRIGGQTLGKMLLGLRVVQLDGHSLTTWHAVRRALGMVLAGIPGLGGFLWAAFDVNRRGWHDRVAGTLVVKVKPPAKAIEALRPSATPAS